MKKKSALAQTLSTDILHKYKKNSSLSLVSTVTNQKLQKP